MKIRKSICVLLLACLCLGMAACGTTAKAESNAPAKTETAAPASDPAPAADKPAATAAPTPAPTPTPEPLDLDAIVADLNKEEEKKPEGSAPYTARYQVSGKPDTIWYKIAISRFDMVFVAAMAKDENGLSLYDQSLNTLLELQDMVEFKLQDTYPELHVEVLVMPNENSLAPAAVISDGEIIFDVVNGIGTEPEGVTPIIPAEES